MLSPAQLARLAIQGGVSFALYAGALALATALQSSHDAAVAASQAPLVTAAERLRLERALTTQQLEQALAMLARAGNRYEAVGRTSQAMGGALARLAADVKIATGSAARLPASLPMPPAPSTVYVTAPAPPPATHTTTGASGR
jgi:hypothetical protein